MALFYGTEAGEGSHERQEPDFQRILLAPGLASQLNFAGCNTDLREGIKLGLMSMQTVTLSSLVIPDHNLSLNQ